MNSPALLVVALSVIFMQGSAEREETQAQNPKEKTKDCEAKKTECCVEPTPCPKTNFLAVRWYYDVQQKDCTMFRLEENCPKSDNLFPNCTSCSVHCKGESQQAAQESCDGYA
uniref:KUN-2-like protein n=1 Tax=Amblyomma americanum TaxID=6943 RepID=B5M7A9_AMBAM